MGVSMEDGERFWQTTASSLSLEMRERPRPPSYGTAFIVYHPGTKQFWPFGEMGDLIIAELSPSGYKEISRAHILEPTNEAFGRPVVWSMPAFASKSAFVRNGKELVRVDLSE